MTYIQHRSNTYFIRDEEKYYKFTIKIPTLKMIWFYNPIYIYRRYEIKRLANKVLKELENSDYSPHEIENRSYTATNILSCTKRYLQDIGESK